MRWWETKQAAYGEAIVLIALGGFFSYLKPDFGIPFLIILLLIGILLIIRAHRKTSDASVEARPNIVYESPWIKPFENAWFACVIVRNNVVGCPSGDISTSKHTRAKIEVFNTKGTVLHSWNARWSDQRWPIDYADIDTQNQRDINAGETARLDIGKRKNGEIEFRAWYNWLPSLPEPNPELVTFNPGSYHIRLSLSASNMGEKKHWFSLFVPNVIQSDSSEQVKVTSIVKPDWYKGDSQT